MDEMFVSPETHRLRKGWTAAMMGMMTLVRVVPDDLYDEIQELKNQQAQAAASAGRDEIGG